MPGEILPIKNKYYELGEAVQRAAEQNVRRDYRLGLITVDKLEDLPAEEGRKYKIEARRVITEFGANYVPNYPETERIHARKLVFLPIEEAVEKVAQQLVSRDQQLGVLSVGDINDLPYERQVFYTTTALNTLKTRGTVLPPSEDFAEQYFVKI